MNACVYSMWPVVVIFSPARPKKNQPQFLSCAVIIVVAKRLWFNHVILCFLFLQCLHAFRLQSKMWIVYELNKIFLCDLKFYTKNKCLLKYEIMKNGHCLPCATSIKLIFNDLTKIDENELLITHISDLTDKLCCSSIRNHRLNCNLKYCRAFGFFMNFRSRPNEEISISSRVKSKQTPPWLLW